MSIPYLFISDNFSQSQIYELNASLNFFEKEFNQLDSRTKNILISENIKKGVELFGVMGNFEGDSEYNAIISTPLKHGSSNNSALNQLITKVSGNIDDFANQIWTSLNEDNKVSLFVRFIDIETGEYESRIFNKNE